MAERIEPYIAAAIQPDLYMCETRADIKKNLDRYEELIDYTVGYYWETGCKLITFPEYFLQGVTTPGKGEHKRDSFLEKAIEIPGPETEVLAKKAKEYGVFIAGAGIVELDVNFPGHWFNTGIIIDPKGDIILRYRKWHVPGWLGLGTSPQDVWDKYKELYGGELKDIFPVADTEIGKLGVYTCYDGWHPEIARALAYNGAEVLVHATATPCDAIDTAADTWTLCNRARAHDNLVYVVAPDWGRVKYPYYPENFCPGNSQIINYDGVIMTQAAYPGESVIGALIDIEALRQRRTKMMWNYWADHRSEIFAEMYAEETYPANLFLEHPPESLAQKMAGADKGFERLYARGTFTKPAGKFTTLAQRMQEAQALGTLKK